MDHFNQSLQRHELLAITYDGRTLFRTHTSNLTPAAQAELDRVAHMMALLPHMDVDMEVHFQLCGSDGQCPQLSRKRFQAIREGLVKNGVAAWRVRAASGPATRTFHTEITLRLISNQAVHPPVPVEKPGSLARRYACQGY